MFFRNLSFDFDFGKHLEFVFFEFDRLFGDMG